MTINGQEVDYQMERARIEAHGFDALRALADNICQECGEIIPDGDWFEVLEGIKIGECCLERDNKQLESEG